MSKTIRLDRWYLSGYNDLPEVFEIEAPEAGASVLSLAEIKTHLRLDEDETVEDTLLQTIRGAAVELVEKHCNMSFLPRKVTCLFSRWPCDGEDFRFPVRPIRSVDEVRYLNEDNVLTTMSTGNYRWRLLKGGAMLAPNYDEDWPDLLDDRYPVEVDLSVGYLPSNPEANPSDQIFPVPDGLKYAMLLAIGDMYENRESQAVSTRIYSSMFDNLTYRRLIANHRLRRSW